LQLDFVNVLAPAHYQVLFSRLGPYKTTLLDDLVFRRREFTEQWAHEASIIPIESWPLLLYRMETHRVRPYPFAKTLCQLDDYVTAVLKQIRANGPITAAELPHPDGVESRIPGAWFGSVPRAVLEACFGRGVLAIASRLPSMARTYDLAERVVPAEHFNRMVSREEAERELLLQAARACGIATAADLADYFRMKRKEALPRLNELVSAGKLEAVRVEGWREIALMHPGATIPNHIDANSLLSPFDPLIWFRPRASRLFGFDHRFEIFVPQEKRRWGAYVLPFLYGDRIAARVDLKADRSTRSLRVVAAYREDHAKSLEVAQALAAELNTLAGWLKLETIVPENRGNLARALRAALRKR
jgi:uncharacterized protein YcaQ